MSGSATRPWVYAIVVNYNGWRDTLECLESLLRSDYPALRVIVCDNASTDGSIEKIRAWARGDVPAPQGSPALARLSFPPVAKPVSLGECTAEQLTKGASAERSGPRVLLARCDRNLGFAGANNIGLKHMLACDANAYALLFNNDAVIAPDAIAAMVARAEQTISCGAIGATVLQYQRPDNVETLGGGTISRITGMVTWVNPGADRREPRPSSVSIDYVTGCCLLVSAATIETVGLMAEQYFLYGEDADWCLRMTQRGRRVDYCASAEIWHKGGTSVVHRSAVHDYYAVRGTLMLIHRHFPSTLPLALANAIVRFILPKLARGEWQRLGAAARGYRDFFRYLTRPTNEQPA